MNLRLFTEILGRNFPQLSVDSINQIFGGWDSYVFEINDDLIFKFPKNPEIENTIKKEIRLLPELAKVLSVKVPVSSFVGEHEDKVFFGYRKIQGLPLVSCDYNSADLADQVAHLISEIHGFPAHKALTLGVPKLKWRSEYAGFYHKVKRRIFPLMNASLQEKAVSVLEGFLDNDDHFQFEPVFTHHDLSADGHILCDPKRGEITGIIDWGDAVIGDPAIDFTGLYWDCGEQFAKNALAKYDGMVDDTFWERTVFYYRIGGFYEIEHGQVTQDETHVQKGLSHLSKTLQQV
jgi:aminoglycoside 2''-phosphotransferase